MGADAPSGTGASGATSGRTRLPRLLTIMGSGETAPTMVKVHRSVVEQLAAASAAGAEETASQPKRPASIGIILDTPFGFQTNAEEIGTRAVTYFRESVGATVEVAGMRAASDLNSESGDRLVTRLAELPLVFAGPGSPSYALRQWRGTLVPSLLSEKLALGGAVTFASAAALTLGIATVPVYEIYKVGEDPHWLEGLDLLRPLGLPVVFIPHYDNSEGQTHDTRFCYLGEERLALMETQLEAGTFVLGIDEHTALCIDLESQKASVVGRGGVTVRVKGRSARVEEGETVALSRLLQTAEDLATARALAVSAPGAVDESGSADRARSLDVAAPQEPVASPSERPAEGAATRGLPTAQLSPLLQTIRDLESEFRSAQAASDAGRMVRTVLALEDELWAWRADTLQSDEMDRGRASLRSMIEELGRLSEVGTQDPAVVIGPYVEVALALRDTARNEKRFDAADDVRKRLEALGVAIHDTPAGSTWELRRDRRGQDGPRERDW